MFICHIGNDHGNVDLHIGAKHHFNGDIFENLLHCTDLRIAYFEAKAKAIQQ